MSSIVCPHCSHKADSQEFYQLLDSVTTILRKPASVLRHRGWRKWFATPDTRQLYACPQCGKAFINLNLEA